MCRRFALSAFVILFVAATLWGKTQPAQLRSGIWRGKKVTYTWVPGKGGRSKAIYQGDILLEHVSDAPPAAGVDSFGNAYSQYLWPKVGSVHQVPYIIDPASGAVANINAAITKFNTTFAGVIQFVAHGSETNYVDFNLDPNNNNGQCEATEGDAGAGEQFATGAGGTQNPCTVATILHEMGHIAGLWHEQGRPDRDTYLNVNYNAVIKASRSNFDVPLDTEGEQTLTLFDYASIMEYPAFSFSRNGQPCIETIPAGIPLSNANGYSASDIDGVLRLYGAAPTQVTVTSNPPGLQVIVDGTTVTTPQTYNWALNSTHTLNVPPAGQTLGGISYVYGRWNDATSQNHSITVAPGNNMVTQPATSPAVTVYSANFVQLVPYVNVISPANSGTVAPSPAPQTYSGLSGQFYVIRQAVTLTATPAQGQNFYNYINSPFWLPGANGANPKTFNVMDDGSSINLITYFTSSPVYTVTTSPLESNYWVIVDTAYLHAPANFALPYDPGWTPSSSHSVGTYSPQYPWSSSTRFAFSSWSDGGAETHNVTLPASGGATYTDNITPQYYVADYALEGTCAASINVSPGSPTGDGFYPAGSLISFGETPASGLSFTGWLYDLSGTGSPQNLTVSDEVLVAADYNVNSTRLTISSLSPASAAAGGGPFTLTINGTGFTPSTYVYINGFFRAVATFVSSTQVTIPLSASDIAAPGAFQVAVGNFNTAGCGPYVPTDFFVLINSNPTAGVSPTSLSFGNQAAGTTSTAQTVTLTNSGTGALSIGSITASGNFSQTNNCGTSLAASGNCTINVSFAPTNLGAFTGAITLNDSAGSSPQLIALTGTGVAPLTFKPASLALGTVAVGSTSSKTVTVTNNQTTAISLSAAASADYSVTGGTCALSLGAGSNCTITVKFAPSITGAINGALAITTNGAFSPQIVALTGTGKSGPTVPLTFSPTMLSFSTTGVGSTSAAKTVTVTNGSASSVTISGISASADYAAGGSGATPCGGALAAGASCSLSVTFTPAAAGTVKGSVALATNGAGSPQFINVSGKAVVPVTLSPASLTFAAQTVGTTSAAQTVTLTNNSGGTLSIASIAASGDFTAAPSGTKPCGATVAKAAKCTFSVTFTPNVAGSISGAATVTHSAPLGPAVINLTGTGQ
jgi:hypothetical protein